jgi:hypothetical protein
MPILIPIQDAPLLETTVAGVLAGATEMTGELTVRLGLRGNLAGSTQISAALGGRVALAGQLIGSTGMSGFLRINDEPNIFLAGSLEGATEMSGTLILKAGLNGELEGSTALAGELTVHHPVEPSIVIFVDILDSAIVASQHHNLRRYNARLLVDGDEVPIRQATLEARKDTLGTELRVVLARADTSQVSFASTITFEIGLWTGAAWVWVPLLAGGKLSALDNPVKNDSGRPADEVSISILDVIADRWNRAPRAPIHLYDPLELDAPDQSQIAAQRIELQSGEIILPVNVPIGDMALSDVLNEAYVEGTGFSAVVTNIPDFPVAETDFTLDGGYDAGVRPLLQLFAPLLFERNNLLFVIDPDAPLPAGFSPRAFPQSLTRDLTDAIPQREPVNAILLRLKSDTAGDFFTERIDADTSSAGTFGNPSFTETTIEKRTREYRNFVAPETIVREEVVSEKTTVLDFQFTPIEITELTQSYDALNRKTGHQRRVAKRLPDLNNDGVLTLLEDVTRQSQQITYRPDPLNPSRDVQDIVTTVESGLILVDAGNQYLENPYKIPLTDAHVSGYLDPSGDQQVEQGDIRTTTEALRVRGQQVDVEIRVVNHLANAGVQTSLTTRPGAISVDRRRQAAATRTILITTPGTDAGGRRAQTFDAGFLPADIAIELGERKLRRLNSPPRQIALNPAYVDIAIKRGSLLAVHGRDDALIGTYIVEGYSITFESFQPDKGSPASMSVTAREVVN